MIQFLAKSTRAHRSFGHHKRSAHHLLSSITPRTFFTFAALLALTLFAPSLRAESSDRPNIVLILADDMGYSDIGCYGSEIPTPNLDNLAARGLRFTQFYNNGRCCPTRASLLTGLYPHQAGIGHMMEDQGFDGYRGDLANDAYTIAEALRPCGYRNYAVGKWHVTKKVKPKQLAGKDNWPMQRGFDRFYGTIHGAGSFYDPNSLTRDNTSVSPYADPDYQPSNYFYTDAISDHAARFITEHSDQHDAPFFMYVAYTAAHWPLHAREEDIAKHHGRYHAGYQAIRDARFERMLKLGSVSSASVTNFLIPETLKEAKYWEWDQRNMEVYAAMIEQMDRGIGKIVQSLRDADQLDNTLILFMQDNGGCQEEMGRGKVGSERAAKPTLAPMAADELQPDMIPKQTRDGFPMRQGKNVMAGPADTYEGYGYAWATVSNTPFRMYKHFVHEGGISTPLIAHWPAGIARAGQWEHTPSHLIDIMPTLIELAEGKPLEQRAGLKTKQLDGRSLKPLFSGVEIESRPLFWEHEGNRAVRDGKWKLVALYDHPWELYDLSSDRSEQHDLSAKEPERVKRLEEQWQRYAERTGVVDWSKIIQPNKQP